MGEKRQEESMCLGPGEDLLFLVERMDHWQTGYVGQRMEHRAGQKVKVCESSHIDIRGLRISELLPSECPSEKGEPRTKS